MSGLSLIATIRINQWRIARDEEMDRLHKTCEGHWVKRHGKHGTFWGCSTWPRCRMTKDYEPDWDDD